jgi:predicted oxidoreductase
METLRIGSNGPLSSRLIYGCMRITGDQSPDSMRKGKEAIIAAFDAGYNHFDHADIYGKGHSELLFGEVLAAVPGMRREIIITSKCGIRRKDDPFTGAPQRYDFSREYIIASVEGSLKRMGIEKLDILLLHRPDLLMNPDEIAQAFDLLRQSGKVEFFGVSNFLPSQVRMLQSHLNFPLIANQVEINIHNISSLLNGTLDQCLELGLSPEAWCPLGGVAYEAWGNTFSDADKQRISAEFARQSEHYNTEPWIIMLAWILKHPSKIFPVIGSTNPGRIKAAKAALELPYTREDWYRLLEARNGSPLP